LKEEALDRTMWRNRFGRGFGPVVWQITDDDDDDKNEEGYWVLGALQSTRHTGVKLGNEKTFVSTYILIKLSLRAPLSFIGDRRYGSTLSRP